MKNRTIAIWLELTLTFRLFLHPLHDCPAYKPAVAYLSILLIGQTKLPFYIRMFLNLRQSLLFNLKLVLLPVIGIGQLLI